MLLDAARCCSTLFDAAQRCLTLLDATQRCSTLLDATQFFEGDFCLKIGKYLQSQENGSKTHKNGQDRANFPS
jgi:hypothetical protein